MSFTTEEITHGTYKVIKAERIPSTCFLFHVLLAFSVKPSLNTFKSSRDFITLIISFISSFEIVNRSPALTDPFPFIYLPSLSITFEVALHLLI